MITKQNVITSLRILHCNQLSNVKYKIYYEIRIKIFIFLIYNFTIQINSKKEAENILIYEGAHSFRCYNEVYVIERTQ